MYWKEIESESDYKNVVKRAVEIFHPKAGSSEEKELEVLLVSIKDYEDKNDILPDGKGWE